ncbi:uncharacterized protein LOC118564421 [Fundulus heteroclitus]|uniref:uncharacterized protein LOC118564421 n=1 Tax=Fundulus heteroclitus TaxID=8078 RepID=UPI00165C23AF|nr:uncharacterized protein LOC118564421 [Fundulus heteroclitus]
MASQEEDGGDEMESGEWSQVSRRKDRSKTDTRRREEGKVSNKRSLGEDSPEEEIRIIRRKIEGINLGPVALSKELKHKVGEVESAKILRDGSLLIKCKDEVQRNKALKIDSVCKKVVSDRRVLEESKGSSGVIYGIPVEEDLEKLRRNIQGGEVKKVRRLLRTVDGERVNSLSVLLEFQDSVLPERVKIGCMSYFVRPYVPPPLRCYKCQRYGHVAAVCKGKQRCPRCGGEHRYEECKGDEQMKCCNCGGQHSVTYAGCEVRKKAVEVQKVKMGSNISYAEAVKRVQGQNSGVEARKVIHNIRSENSIREQVKTTTNITTEKLILFIAYVINCTDQVKHKTEKIKIIIKGVEKFLDMRELSWEQVKKQLETDGKPGSGEGRAV